MLEESGSIPEERGGIPMGDADDGVDGGTVGGAADVSGAEDASAEPDGAREVRAAAGPDGAVAETDSGTVADTADDGLLSRLQLIEERPLQDRAEAYGRIHGELVDALEGGDRPELDD